MFLCVEESIASSFIASTEFRHCYRENISDESHVETICTSFIRYIADTCGLNYCLDQIISGAESSNEIISVFLNQLRRKDSLLNEQCSYK
ncbi:DUF4214 domain-containing protein [Prochlorococcus marinus]|uniref:DUF4214 domain-containing protein n=1 Tax=Prochlorococcus marinus TaxID=1219 RepID=UPI003B27D725